MARNVNRMAANEASRADFNAVAGWKSPSNGGSPSACTIQTSTRYSRSMLVAAAAALAVVGLSSGPSEAAGCVKGAVISRPRPVQARPARRESDALANRPHASHSYITVVDDLLALSAMRSRTGANGGSWQEKWSRIPCQRGPRLTRIAVTR
jgi:hypothetical protein